MEWLNRMSAAIDHIEDHLTDDIMYDEVARIACCSMHQFGRVFSYVVGVTLSEYIRRRRLTLAALDFQRNKELKVIDVSMKYGYDSPDAFTRAFHKMHGITPKEARTLGTKLKAYPRISFQISIKGVEEMEYQIIDKEEIQLVGMVRKLKRKKANTTANNWKEAMEEEWTIWREFFDQGMNEKIRDQYKLYRSPMWQMGFTKTLDNGETLLAIGAEQWERSYPDLETYTIPASKWVVFVATGSLSEDEHPIDAMWSRITTEWFPTSDYKRADDFEIQVYPPGDPTKDDYQCEIWIPIVEK